MLYGKGTLKRALGTFYKVVQINKFQKEELSSFFLSVFIEIHLLALLGSLGSLFSFWLPHFSTMFRIKFKDAWERDTT